MLDEHVERGQLIIGEIVYAELASLFLSEKEMRAFLSDTGTKLTHSSEKAFCIAGNRWNVYAKDKKRSLQSDCVTITFMSQTIQHIVVNKYSMWERNNRYMSALPFFYYI